MMVAVHGAIGGKINAELIYGEIIEEELPKSVLRIYEGSVRELLDIRAHLGRSTCQADKEVSAAMIETMREIMPCLS